MRFPIISRCIQTKVEDNYRIKITFHHSFQRLKGSVKRLKQICNFCLIRDAVVGELLESATLIKNYLLNSDDLDLDISEFRPELMLPNRYEVWLNDIWKLISPQTA